MLGNGAEIYLRMQLWRLGLSGELVRRHPVRTVMDSSRMGRLYVKDSGIEVQ
jgi:hypothetical protein